MIRAGSNDAVEPTLWRSVATCAGGSCAIARAALSNIARCRPGRICVPPWPQNKRSWRRRAGASIRYLRTADSSLPIATTIACASPSSASSSPRVPRLGAVIEAELHRPSVLGPPGSLWHLDAAGGSQPDPATAVPFRTPRIRATILAGREHTLKDQAGPCSVEHTSSIGHLSSRARSL
jgi:hypothetical protein